jgi:hypothetical protein
MILVVLATLAKKKIQAALQGRSGNDRPRDVPADVMPCNAGQDQGFPSRTLVHMDMDPCNNRCKGNGRT